MASDVGGVMKVGIDARILNSPKCGGANYLCQLIYHMSLIDQDVKFVLFLPKPPLKEYESFLEHERVLIVVPDEVAGDGNGWPNKFMPKLIRDYEIDIFHQPFNADGAFFRVPCKMVVSILDLIPWVLPGIFRKSFKKWRYKLRNVLWTHYVDKIITISEASQKDIVRLCRVAVGKTAVTHLGADAIYNGFIDSDEEKRILSKYNLNEKRYIINMGGLNQLRRNPNFIIEGFSRFLKESGSVFYLVFTGSVLKQDGFFDRIQAKIIEEGIEDRVIIAGFLSDKDLKVVLSNAEVSVITSLYEGFCLPLTESFVCGVPSIANNRGSVPEIAGDAAVLVDPYKPEELALKLVELSTNSQERKRLSELGKQRAKSFNWKKTAQETLDVYRKVLL